MQHLIEESENRDLHSIHHQSRSVRISFPRHAYMPNSKNANTFGENDKGYFYASEIRDDF